LSKYSKDVPFALLYLLGETNRELRLVSTIGIANELTGPAMISLDPLKSDAV